MVFVTDGKGPERHNKRSDPNLQDHGMYNYTMKSFSLDILETIFVSWIFKGIRHWYKNGMFDLLDFSTLFAIRVRHVAL